MGTQTWEQLTRQMNNTLINAEARVDKQAAKFERTIAKLEDQLKQAKAGGFLQTGKA